jgi:hypothetical protein
MCGAAAAHVDFVRLIAGTEALSEQLAADAVTTGLARAPDEDLQTYRVRLRFLQVSFARFGDCSGSCIASKHTFLRCSAFATCLCLQFVTVLQERLPQLESSALSQTTDDNSASEATIPSVSTLRGYAARVEALRIKRDAILTVAATASIAKTQAAREHSLTAADAASTRAVPRSTAATRTTATAAASSKPRLIPRQSAASNAARSKAGEAERRVADAVAEDISDLANQLKYSATEVSSLFELFLYGYIMVSDAL